VKVTRREAAGVVGAALSLGGAQQPATREAHAVWAGANDAGTSVGSVRTFVSRLKRAHVDKVVMCAKETNGVLYWHSKRFPQAISPSYRDFDLVLNLAREAHDQGIELHLWLCDFHEGDQSAAFREHPDWAQLSNEGKLTNTETLFNRDYRRIWMCPARRPGYTDQWLLPMIEELAENYAIDGIHHDYVRYCGDVAPDSYCFCDYCLRNLPRHALLKWESGPQERRRVEIVRPRLEANWEATPDMLPPGWEQYDRREKADFFLNGRTLPGGPPDLRYFFYEYRVDQITRFVREAWQAVKRINPKVQMSAAVFKNPMQSARYLGQKWCDWTPYIDIFMPMNYRSHFLGSFELYCEHLGEITARQLEWTRREKPLYSGIGAFDLFREDGDASPPVKLVQAVAAARAAKPDGIIVFSAGALTRRNLWPALEEVFGG
jgi:uncharacterized lipoprotein YddW (UPF0748 family)